MTKVQNFLQKQRVNVSGCSQSSWKGFRHRRSFSGTAPVLSMLRVTPWWPQQGHECCSVFFKFF